MSAIFAGKRQHVSDMLCVARNVLQNVQFLCQISEIRRDWCKLLPLWILLDKKESSGGVSIARDLSVGANAFEQPIWKLAQGQAHDYFILMMKHPICESFPETFGWF